MVNETGDVAIVDLASGTYRALGIARGDWSNGYASTSALSPDGTAVAVDWHTADRGELHIVRSDGSDHRVLIDSAADVGVYQWSRDGSLILVAVTGTRRHEHHLPGRCQRWRCPPHPGDRPRLPGTDVTVAGYPLRRLRLPTGSRLSRPRHLHPGYAYRHEWPLDASPGHDSAPLWSPDGRAIVFVSDRQRVLSAWMAPMTNGRVNGEPRLVKEDIGRVWPRGFTRDGALHYELRTGFSRGLPGGHRRPGHRRRRKRCRRGRPFQTSIQSGRPTVATLSTPLNVAPMARANSGFTIPSLVERPGFPADQRLGRPLGATSDGRRVLATGQNDGRSFLVDRATGGTRLLAKSGRRAYWGPEGIASVDRKVVVLEDPATDRRLDSVDFSDRASRPSTSASTAGRPWCCRRSAESRCARSCRAPHTSGMTRPSRGQAGMRWRRIDRQWPIPGLARMPSAIGSLFRSPPEPETPGN